MVYERYWRVPIAKETGFRSVEREVVEGAADEVDILRQRRVGIGTGSVK